MNYYRIFSLFLMIIFALVGIIFLFLTDDVLRFFNTISGYLGMKPSPVHGQGFYLILAVGYMYLVTLLAYRMYKQPENSFFPLLLAHGKLFSSILSFGLFIFHQPYLIYLTNLIVDGLIGIIALYFYQKVKMFA